MMPDHVQFVLLPLRNPAQKLIDVGFYISAITLLRYQARWEMFEWESLDIGCRQPVFEADSLEGGGAYFLDGRQADMATCRGKTRVFQGLGQ